MELVTIGTFPTGAHAQIAKTALEEAGVQAFVTDEAMAGMFSVAVGGAKLHVSSHDVPTARRILTDTWPAQFPVESPSDISFLDEVDHDPSAADAISPDATLETPLDDGFESEQSLTTREDDANRAFRSAILGLFFQPLLLYTAWLLLKVFYSELPLAAKQRNRALVAFVICLPFLLLGVWLLRLLIEANFTTTEPVPYDYHDYYDL